ncbi:hypothetical protein B0H10DRAFT_1813492, partial [Mycena sp. CBHHK59/15]
GWNDLAWPLELNQGFYNAASLAAVCSISEDKSVSWLGKPIDPAPGNERLEPIATAFPISAPPPIADSAYRAISPSGCPPLTVIGGQLLGLRTSLRRDSNGLYKNDAMRSLRWLSNFMVMLSILIGFVLLLTGHLAGLWTYLSFAVARMVVEILVGTIYLERRGWVFFPEAEYGSDIEELQQRLWKQDKNVPKLSQWGNEQLVPQWEAPGRRPWFRGTLIDLASGIYMVPAVVGRPNAMVPLAIHGNGITCMLLHRSDREYEKVYGAHKVGMVNCPPYVLAETKRVGTTIGDWVVDQPR